MKRSINFRRGFTLVEILTTLAIILVIWIIAVTYNENYKLTQYNARRSADLDTLKNTIESYYEVNKTYPEPNWNKQYYDEDGTYTHGFTWSYWVSGFVTTNTFPKQFMNYIPLDPQTKNFYAYSKTTNNLLAYEFATSLNKEWSYFWYLNWNYPWEDLSWLVKEYSWPNFVINWSDKYLPYNPHEIKLTWKINFYSWSITLNNPNDPTREIVEWDQITVDTWSLAEIYLSDWSELILWNNAWQSTLEFKELKYKEDNNIITKIKLALMLGEIWVKAPQLEQDSDFTLETSNASATVRWTIFWMTNFWSSWSINLIEWKLEVQKKKINEESDSDYFESFTGSDTAFSTSSTWFYIDPTSNKSYMEVKSGEKPIFLNIEKQSVDWELPPETETSTWNIEQNTVNEVITPTIPLNSSIIPNILNFARDSTNSSISLDIENKWANYIEITWENNYKTGIIISSWSWIIKLENITGFTWSNNLKIQLFYSWNTVDGTSNSNILNISSAPKTLDIWLKPTALTTNDLNQKNNQQEVKCPKWKEKFATFGCQDENLVAYAPYNKSWDIFMYTKDSYVLWMSSSGVVWTLQEYSLPLNTINTNRISKPALSTTTFSCNPTFDTNSWTFTSGCDWGEENDGVWKKWPIEMIESLWALYYNSGSSYFQLDRNNWWIFIWTLTGAFIKYDMRALWLKDKFVIEMGVRGAALKRIPDLTKPYYLFNTNLNLLLDIFSLNLYDWNNNKQIGTWTIFNLWLKNNELYNVQVTVDWTKRRILQIINKNNSILYNISGTGSYYLDDHINIWNKQWEKQWNDIIDYVKIYKID